MVDGALPAFHGGSPDGSGNGGGGGREEVIAVSAVDIRYVDHRRTKLVGYHRGHGVGSVRQHIYITVQRNDSDCMIVPV